MIEAVVRNYLESAGFQAYMETPVRPEEEYLLIEKTGSGRQNQIETATIAVQCISKKSLFRSAQMCEQMIEVMNDFSRLDEIFSCKLVSDYNYTNTATKEYRYQAIFTLSY